MRTLSIAICICLLSLFSSGAQATTLTKTYTPSIQDLNDLEHGLYYTWTVNTSAVPDNAVLKNAVLTITNIYDWQPESTDKLYMYLLNALPSGGTAMTGHSDIRYWSDSEDPNKGFSSYAKSSTWYKKIGVWTDPDVAYTSTHKTPGVNTDFDKYGNYTPIKNQLSYDFASLGLVPTLKTYMTDDIFYLGFDPDCHYYNDKIMLTLYFDVPCYATPEPSTLALAGLGLGLGGLLAWRRKRQ